MPNGFGQIFQGVLDRLHNQATTVLPGLLAAAIIVLTSFLIALAARALLYRIFKGLAIDRFLRRSGVAYIMDKQGSFRATRLVAEGAYAAILITGFLTGLSAFNSQLADHIIQGFVLLMPKLVVAALIIVGGVWASQYFGRGLLVWAVNEGLPAPRRLAAICRVMIVFISIVVAADQMDFAPRVFLAAFIILIGGFVLLSAIALGSTASAEFKRFFQGAGHEPERIAEKSLWNQL